MEGAGTDSGPTGRSRRRPLAVGALIASLALVALIAVLATTGGTGGDDSTSTATTPSTSTTTVATSSTTPTADEVASAALGGLFVGSYRTPTTCEGFESMRVAGSEYLCPGPEWMEFRCEPEGCTVDVYDYFSVPIEFDGHAWTAKVWMQSGYPRPPECGGGQHQVQLSIRLQVSEAVADRRAPSGWRAAVIEGTLSEESTDPCEPLLFVAELYDFRPT